MENLLKKRRKNTHKGRYGRVGVIAGSKGMTGAPYLVCQSALKTGSGLVYNILPESLTDVMSIKLTEAIIKPINDKGKGQFTIESIKPILKEIKTMNVLALGPGMGIDKERSKVVQEIIKSSNSTLEIDADGLNTVAKYINILNESKSSVIITPHPGEMGRLLNKDINEIEEKREYYVKYLSEKYNVITVLKGYETIVAAPNGEIYINSTGNPGMATAGSGDVLTGIMTSLLGQGLEIFDVAKLGVYIHGLAGDRARDKIGEYGMIATDIIDAIPYVIKDIVK